MRKMAALLLSVVFLWILTSPVQAAPAPAPAVRVFLDGTQVHFDVDPILENGRTLVPVRALSEALGFTVTWDETENLVSLSRDGMSIVLWIDSTKVLVGAKESHLEVPTRVVNGRTMVPLRFISETLGSHVAWDHEQFTASIISDKQLRSMLLKSLQTPMNQIAEGEFLTTVTIKGDGIPGGGLTVDSEMSFTSHIYKNEMYVKTSALLPFAPPTVVEVAAFDGAIWIKDSAMGVWAMAGAYDPENIAEASAYTGIQGMNGVQLQEEMLGAARFAGVKAVQVGGEKALSVTVDLSNLGLEEAIQQFSATGLMPEADTSMSASVERFMVTYVIQPDTGFIYQTDIDMAVTIDVSDSTGSGQIAVVLKGSAAAHPTTEPVQFPAGLTK